MGSFLWSRRLQIGVFLGAVGLFHMLCPLQIGVVSGASMEPTFHTHQVILVDRRYYNHHPVRRGEVIIAREGDMVLIKRVFALGGDTLWTLLNADDGELYREIVDPAMLPRVQRLMPLLPSYRLTRYRVPAGTVYVVGDNTSASVDSRHFGPIPMTDVMGRVVNAPPATTPTSLHLADREECAPGHGTIPIARASLR
jgi:signal peptidase I